MPIYRTSTSNILLIRLIFIAALLMLQSCGIKKYIPEGELLYTGGSVAIQSDTLIKHRAALVDALEEILQPKPNKKFLGMRLGVFHYYKNQKENPGFINKWLYKQFGEEPVYRSDVKTTETEDLLLKRLENHGFFYSRVSSHVIEKENKKQAFIQYTADVPLPYTMASYKLDTLSPPIYKAMQDIIATSELKPGIRFRLSALKLERERIDQELKKKGYYNFDSRLIIFEADTNQHKNRRFDLFLKLKKNVPKTAIMPYRITKVNVYPDYDVQNDTLQHGSVSFNEKNYIQEEVYFKPKYLDPFIKINKGDLYNPLISKNTAKRLSTIGAYKFVNIQYKETDTVVSDRAKSLEANIFLSPLNKRSIRAELQAVAKSNNFAGPALGLTFSNRNLFKGGETLNINAKAGYEVQVASGTRTGLESIVLGLKSDLIFPRVISPFKINRDFFKYAIPKTKIGVGAEYLSRSKLYKLLSGTGQFGYLWNANRYVTHEIYPIAINYTNVLNTTAAFEQILENNPFLRRSFQQQFISGLNYSFSYNEMANTRKKHQFYLQSTLDVAGNSIGWLGRQQEDQDSKTFLGLTYAQYAKADVDFRYHFHLGNDQKIAARLFAGYGFAYGNSDILPFIKQYFAGGPYSVRAFRIRSLGPGTFSGSADDGSAFFDQTGNIRLEANLEYRFPVAGFLKGALFADAGNVWLSKENPSLPGGKFTGDFLSELGMGMGFGLRIDVQGFVVRFDLAAPFHDPSANKGERFTIKINEPLLNFAIGYPF